MTRTMKWLKFLPVVLICAGSTALAEAASVKTPETLTEDCKNFISSIESRYTYGWINSAEIPDPSSVTETISIFYYHKKIASLKNPVIFFNGGPGFTSHGITSSLEVAKVKLSHGKSRDIDFIFMDQRGTGCSTPFPKGANAKTLEQLKWYGSAGIVSDAEHVRKKLIGSRKWKIFGQSFGAHVVHRYIQMFPKSITKAYAHGYAEGASDFDRSFARIASQHFVLENYLKKFPSDRERLNVLNTYLSDSSRCFRTSGASVVELCGYEISSIFVMYLGFTSSWGQLHRDLSELVPSDTVVPEAVQNFVQSKKDVAAIYHNTAVIDEDYLASSSLALNVIGVSDTNSTPNDLNKCLAIYQKMELVYKVKPTDILLDECKTPIQFQYTDQILPFLQQTNDLQLVNQITLQEIKLKLRENKIPLFLYSGALDCLIPKELFEAEVKALGKLITYTNFSESGHDGFFTEARIINDLAN